MSPSGAARRSTRPCFPTARCARSTSSAGSRARRRPSPRQRRRSANAPTLPLLPAQPSAGSPPLPDLQIPDPLPVKTDASLFEFGEVGPPWWNVKPVVIVGTGPSLKGFDFSRLEGLGWIFAVKESIWDLPFADALFSLDRPWINRQADRLRALTIPIYLAIEPESRRLCAHIKNATYLTRTRFEGLSDDPKVVQSGGNSGGGAFNLAYLKRAREIVLFGFDFSANGGHYTDRYLDWQPEGHNARYFPNWGSNFRAALPQLERAGVKVLNACPESTVDAFPRCTIGEALQRLDRLRSERSCSIRGGAAVDQGTPDRAAADLGAGAG